MTVELITKADLSAFRHELLNDLKQIIGASPIQQKKWLKSPEVKKMLGISSGTLQNLRINGTLSFTKLGGIIYYSQEDIRKLLENDKSNGR